MATLCAVLGLDLGTLKLHNEDAKTTHNCPGKNVDKAKFIADVRALMEQPARGEHPLVA